MCLSTVYTFCRDHAISSCKLLCAVSGGSDSVALLHLMVALRSRLGLEQVAVAHVNHGLRPEESAKEAVFVRELAQQTGCAFYYCPLEGKTLEDPGIEEWARDQRYRFFLSLKREHGYSFIATGHTAQDQAETVLMRLMRGSGSAGVCGIHAVRDDGVVRPMLGLNREQLRAWLRFNNYAWCEDSTNEHQQYQRNWTRHTLIPLLQQREPKIVEHLAAFAQQMQQQRQILQPLINKWISDFVIEDRPQRFVLRKQFLKSDRTLASEAVVHLFRHHAISFEHKNIDRFFLATDRSSGCFLLKDGWRYYPGKERIVVECVGGDIEVFKNDWKWRIAVPGTTECREIRYCFYAQHYSGELARCEYDHANVTVFFDSDKCGDDLFAGVVKEADTFQPLGSERIHNCLKYLKHEKVSAYFRNVQPVVRNTHGTIVWIPEIALAHPFRITPETKRIVRISCARMV